MRRRCDRESSTVAACAEKLTVSQADDWGKIFIVSPCYVSAWRSIRSGRDNKCDTGQPLDGACSYGIEANAVAYGVRNVDYF